METVEEQLKNIRTAGGKSFYETQRHRVRITAIVLAMSTVMSLVFLVYGFLQKQRSDGLESELVKLRQELLQCQSR